MCRIHIIFGCNVTNQTNKLLTYVNKKAFQQDAYHLLWLPLDVSTGGVGYTYSPGIPTPTPLYLPTIPTPLDIYPLLGYLPSPRPLRGQNDLTPVKTLPSHLSATTVAGCNKAKRYRFV